MTRSNIEIRLSNGRNLLCVAESSSAPEQGYFVQSVILPLLALRDGEKELLLLNEHCTLHEKRSNACYRYCIDLQSGSVRFFEEKYNYTSGRFRKGADLTPRYLACLEAIEG